MCHILRTWGRRISDTDDSSKSSVAQESSQVTRSGFAHSRVKQGVICRVNLLHWNVQMCCSCLSEMSISKAVTLWNNTHVWSTQEHNEPQMKRGSVEVVLYTGTGLLGCALSIIGSAPPTTYLKDTGNKTPAHWLSHLQGTNQVMQIFHVFI